MSFTHTFVTLNPGAKVSKDAVAADIAATFPFAPPVTVGQSEKEGVVSFDFGKVSVMAGLMPAPIPSGDLEACYPSSWLWPEAREQLATHTQHLIMMAQGGDTHLERITLLTVVMASIFGCCPEASGTYWGNAGQLIRGDAFRGMAKDFLPDRLPVFLWVGLRAGPNENGTTSGYTVGLDQFELMEFETLDSPKNVGDVRLWLGDLATYVIRNGPVIQDGHTVGQSAGEKIKVAYTASRFGRKGQVMRLVHGRAAERPATKAERKEKKGW